MFIQRLLLVKYVHGIKKNQLNGQVYNDSDRGNNKGERRYKISLCKVCFLARKDKQRDRGPSPFGPFYWPKWRTPTLSYTTASEISPFLYLKPKKGTPFARSLPMKAIMWSTPRDKKRHKWPPEWTLLSNAYTSLCSKTTLPLHGSSKFEWVHFHPVGSQCIKSNLIKILLMKNWKKTLFLS